MNYVWLVYLDDYGGTFSPYLLSKIFAEDQEENARNFLQEMGGIGVVRKAEFKGWDKSLYPNSVGGLF